MSLQLLHEPETEARSPSDSPLSAGPMGIMVATRPIIGATREAMRGVSRS